MRVWEKRLAWSNWMVLAVLVTAFGATQGQARGTGNIAGQCLTTDALAQRGTILAEIQLQSSVTADLPLPRSMVVVGDPSSRKVEVFESDGPANPHCYRLRHAGYAWASSASRRSRDSVSLNGLQYQYDPSADSGYCERVRSSFGQQAVCVAQFGSATKAGSAMLGTSNTLAAYFVANMSYAPTGEAFYDAPRTWRFYRSRRGEVRIVIGELGRMAAFLSSTGHIESMKAVAGDSQAVNDWRAHVPPLPGTTLPLLAAQRSDANPASRCAQNGGDGNVVATGKSSGTNGLPVELRTDGGGRWNLVMLPSADCRVVLVQGHGLGTSDYVIDQFRQPASYTNRYVAVPGASERCKELQRIYKVMTGNSVLCGSLPDVIAHEGGPDRARGQALHGFAVGTDGAEYEMTLFATGAGDRSFRLYQTWPDGLTRLAFEGRDFAFAPRLQELHFADRRAGERALAEQARFAQQRAREQAALAAQAEERRQADLAAAERRRRAAMTPQQRMEEHIREQNAQVLAYMDEVVTRDSQGWIFNRYKQGSMRNLYIHEVSQDGRSFHARADYTFNGSATGWVDFEFVNGRLVCIGFWDSECRPVGWNNRNILEMLFGDLP